MSSLKFILIYLACSLGMFLLLFLGMWLIDWLIGHRPED